MLFLSWTRWNTWPRYCRHGGVLACCINLISKGYLLYLYLYCCQTDRFWTHFTHPLHSLDHELNNSLYDPPAYLAGVEHVGDGPSAEVGRGDNVFLTTRVTRSHCLCCCHGDSFSHANELLRCGCRWWWVSAAEHLCGKTRGLLMKYLIKCETQGQCSE